MCTPGAASKDSQCSSRMTPRTTTCASQVLTALPPARLAGALLGGGAGGSVDAALVERLEWLRCRLYAAQPCSCPSLMSTGLVPYGEPQHDPCFSKCSSSVGQPHEGPEPSQYSANPLSESTGGCRAGRGRSRQRPRTVTSSAGCWRAAAGGCRRAWLPEPWRPSTAARRRATAGRRRCCRPRKQRRRRAGRSR